MVAQSIILLVGRLRQEKVPRRVGRRKGQTKGRKVGRQVRKGRQRENLKLKNI